MRVERVRGSALELFEGPEVLGGAVRPSSLVVRVLEVTGPAVVLGRAQPVATEGAASAGVDVVRRSSGGGAVWVDDAMVWLDVWVPSAHPRWLADVGAATWWVGDAVAQGLAAVGVVGLTVHRSAMVHVDGSREVCWLGRGAGEVFDAGGRKVAGIAARRVREGALFQVGVLLAPSQWRLAAVLSPAVARAVIEAAEVGCGVARADVEAALLDALTAAAAG